MSEKNPSRGFSTEITTRDLLLRPVAETAYRMEDLMLTERANRESTR